MRTDYFKINSDMTRIIFFIACLFSVSLLFSQEKVSTKTGQIIFEASVPSFEEVKATNNNVSAILDTRTGAFASLALVKGFRFKVALMEEHFNENYIESDTYPKAVFKGKIENFDIGSVNESPKEFMISGTISLHGVTNELKTPVTIQKVDGEFKLTTRFVLRPADFNIKIPGIVSNKIAEEVNVRADYTLKD
jgi:hypothetical protein